MVKEYYIYLILQLKLFILDSLLMEKNKAEEKSLINWEIFMKDNGMMISAMDLVFINMQMETFMRELLRKEKKKVLVLKDSVMGIFIEGST